MSKSEDKINSLAIQLAYASVNRRAQDARMTAAREVRPKAKGHPYGWPLGGLSGPNWLYDRGSPAPISAQRPGPAQPNSAHHSPLFLSHRAVLPLVRGDGLLVQPAPPTRHPPHPAGNMRVVQGLRRGGLRPLRPGAHAASRTSAHSLLTVLAAIPKCSAVDLMLAPCSARHAATSWAL